MLTTFEFACVSIYSIWWNIRVGKFLFEALSLCFAPCCLAIWRWRHVVCHACALKEANAFDMSLWKLQAIFSKEWANTVKQLTTLLGVGTSRNKPVCSQTQAKICWHSHIAALPVGCFSCLGQLQQHTLPQQKSHSTATPGELAAGLLKLLIKFIILLSMFWEINGFQFMDWVFVFSPSLRDVVISDRVSVLPCLVFRVHLPPHFRISVVAARNYNRGQLVILPRIDS